MAPLRLIGNAISAFKDFYARTGAEVASGGSGGGGKDNQPPDGNGGAGGSGICIVRYQI